MTRLNPQREIPAPEISVNQGLAIWAPARAARFVARLRRAPTAVLRMMLMISGFGFVHRCFARATAATSVMVNKKMQAGKPCRNPSRRRRLPGIFYSGNLEARLAAEG